MAMNPVRVKSKAAPRPKRRLRILPWIAAASALLVLAALPFGYDYYSGKLGILLPQPVVTETAQGRVIKVPPGGNLQGALERAQSGDVIELQAGAVYAGQIDLPNKPLTDFVTIRSSAAADLPADQRVKPSQRSSMATITSGMAGRAAVMAANGAHHYRFVGIEFTSSGSIFNYGVVVLGGGEKRPENVPHTIEIDRSYIHPHKPGRSRRGIALNSADTTIKNSYIEGFAGAGEETQGICGWTGTRNVTILNNYIEGGAENILFGGADPANAELIPTEIQIRQNHLNKPADWVKGVTVKTIFELKNAKKVQFTGNLLTNNWEGSAFRITVRNQDGAAPFSTIEDVTIRDNIIKGSGDGFNILGTDDTYDSQMLKRLEIVNNLLLDIGEREFSGRGYFIQVASGEGILIANNTVFNQGNIAIFHRDPPRAFEFRDNIVGHGEYGIHGLTDIRSAESARLFRNNVIVNNRSVLPSDMSFPTGNLLVPGYDSVGFINLADNDLRLSGSSKFKDIGCDFQRIPEEIRNRINAR